MFYDRFIQLCNEHNVAPTRAALEAGLSKSTVTKWKNAPDSQPSGAVIQKLSDYFGITRAELLGEEPTIAPSKFPSELSGAYLSFARTAQEQKIDPADIMLAIETIQKLRGKE